MNAQTRHANVSRDVKTAKARLNGDKRLVLRIDIRKNTDAEGYDYEKDFYAEYYADGSTKENFAGLWFTLLALQQIMAEQTGVNHEKIDIRKIK